MIDWRARLAEPPRPPSPAMLRAFVEIDAAMDAISFAIISQRAQDMLAGRLSYTFCPKAAALARSLEKAA